MFDHLMKIYVNGRTVNLARPVKIGTQGENLAVILTFHGIPHIRDGQLVTLNWLTDGDEPVGDICALDYDDELQAYVMWVETGLTQFAGRQVTAYLEVTYNPLIWRSEPFLLDATALPEVEATLEPTDPTIIQQVKDALEQANAAATRAEEAAQRAEEAGGGIDEEQLQEAVESALSQAKESGEFDGPQGDPGKTAYQYAQDGGYTGTEADFANKLAAEYLPADTVIPAPYILPPATADTLGGVKVGDGLIMDGETLKTKNGVYEPIDTITMQESAPLELDQEPDGTPYQFKRVMVLFIHPANSTGNVYGRYYCGATEIGRGYIPDNNNTSTAYSMHEILIEAGLWRSYYKSKVSTKEKSANTDSFYTGDFYMQKESNYPSINRILFDNLSDGFAIKIFGVRA